MRGGLGAGLSPVVHFRRRRRVTDERARPLGHRACSFREGTVPSVAAPLRRRAPLVPARSAACSMRRPGAGALVRLPSSASFAWRKEISTAAKEVRTAVRCGHLDMIEAWDLNARHRVFNVLLGYMGYTSPELERGPAQRPTIGKTSIAARSWAVCSALPPASGPPHCWSMRRRPRSRQRPDFHSSAVARAAFADRRTATGVSLEQHLTAEQV